MTTTSTSRARGFACALGAHMFWGLMPLYLLLVQSVPSLEFVAWRLIFTLPLCLGVIALRNAGDELRAVLRDGRALLTLLGSSTMIAVNWYFYVWAIQHGYIYAASLGYYILPLVMMLMGLVILKERLSQLQWVAIALAAIGVSALATGALTTLWLSVTMAISFGTYGLLRKKVAAGALVGLTVEAMILTPVALGIVIFYAASEGGSALAQGWPVALAVGLSGPMTAIPLVLFAIAARALRYTLIGFLQFTSPTLVFLLGVTVFGEPLKTAQLACFVMIWIAAGLFVWELLRGRRPPPGDEAASHGAAV